MQSWSFCSSQGPDFRYAVGALHAMPLRGFFVFDFHRGVYIAPGLKIALDFELQWVSGSYEIIHDLVDGFLVGNVAIAIAIDIELDCL